VLAPIRPDIGTDVTASGSRHDSGNGSPSIVIEWSQLMAPQ
jgi:hypothetical protein